MVSQDQDIAECFESPQIIAFKKNSPPLRIQEKGNIRGMPRYGKQCTACPYIKEGQSIQNNQRTWEIKKNCESRNIIYMIECKKVRCKTQLNNNV